MAATPNSGIPKGPQESEDLQSTADMTAFVQNLLMQMQTRFQSMSETIVSKSNIVSEFSPFILELDWIDELEQSINDLKAEMGADATLAKAKPEETKPESAE